MEHQKIRGVGLESVGYLLQVLAKRFEAERLCRLRAAGIDSKYFTYLRVLLTEHEGISQKAFGKQLALPEYQVSRVIDALEQDGFVKRHPCPTSRRTTLVSLTDEGRTKAATIPSIIWGLNDHMLSCFTEEERGVLLKLLQKLHSSTDS